ncbi:MAG: hypothetical protein JO240_03740 [Solirubrobacterales bacterium]|nr:hypothetical protein [Solirubrobacterales bacterium]
MSQATQDLLKFIGAFVFSLVVVGFGIYVLLHGGFVERIAKGRDRLDRDCHRLLVEVSRAVARVHFGAGRPSLSSGKGR